MLVIKPLDRSKVFLLASIIMKSSQTLDLWLGPSGDLSQFAPCELG